VWVTRKRKKKEKRKTKTGPEVQGLEPKPKITQTTNENAKRRLRNPQKLDLQKKTGERNVVACGRAAIGSQVDAQSLSWVHAD
jgi:hypothetical protein